MYSIYTYRPFPIGDVVPSASVLSTPYAIHRLTRCLYIVSCFIAPHCRRTLHIKVLLIYNLISTYYIAAMTIYLNVYILMYKEYNISA